VAGWGRGLESQCSCFGGAGLQIESVALRSESGCLRPLALCGGRLGEAGFWREIEGLSHGGTSGAALGKAGFWREIEGGWQFPFEIQVETREEIGPPEKLYEVRFFYFPCRRESCLHLAGGDGESASSGGRDEWFAG